MFQGTPGKVQQKLSDCMIPFLVENCLLAKQI